MINNRDPTSLNDIDTERRMVWLPQSLPWVPGEPNGGKVKTLLLLFNFPQIFTIFLVTIRIGPVPVYVKDSLAMSLSSVKIMFSKL